MKKIFFIIMFFFLFSFSVKKDTVHNNIDNKNFFNEKVMEVYYAEIYKDSILSERVLRDYLEKILLTEKEIEYAVFLSYKETSMGKYGIGKPPINNIIGMKLAFKRRNWGDGLIKDYYNKYDYWTYCYLDYKYYIKKYKNFNYNDYKKVYKNKKTRY